MFARNKNHIHSSYHYYICIYLTILVCAKFCAYLDMNEIWPVFKRQKQKISVWQLTSGKTEIYAKWFFFLFLLPPNVLMESRKGSDILKLNG